MKLTQKRYGMSTVLKRIEHEVLFGELGYEWMCCTTDDKERVRAKIKRIIRDELLGEEFLIAIAHDMLPDGTVNVHSHIFKYLRNRLYNCNTRVLISDLQQVKAKAV